MFARAARKLATTLRLEQLEIRDVPSIEFGPIVNPANGHTYYRLTQSSWSAAESQAVSLGGHLATINDAEENTWVAETFGSPTESWRIWIGLNDLSTPFTYIWSSGEPSGYRNWGVGQPSFFGNGPEHCVEVHTFAGQPYLWNDLPDSATAGAIPGGIPMKGIVEISTPANDIHMLSAELQSGNAVRFTYETAGNPGPFEVALYRSADGTTYSPADQIATQTVTPSPTNPQTPGTFSLPSPWTPDPTKPYLVVVADSNNAITESDEQNNTASVGLPDIAISGVRLQTPTTLQFTYETQGSPVFYQVSAYRSADGNTYNPADLIATTFITTPSAPGGSPGTITLSSEIPIDPVKQHVLLVADPTKEIAESNEINNGTSFRKIAIAAVSHGFIPFELGGVPQWETDMVARLEEMGYRRVIEFDWASTSWLPIPNMATGAGVDLAAQVRTAVSQLATLPTDVIDLLLIGHSRGAVVISQAAFNLNINPGSTALSLGYVKMTMLDPHPARNSIPGPLGVAQGLAEVTIPTGNSFVGSFSYNPTLGLRARLAIAASVLTVQAGAQDPTIIITPNVDETESYYQRKRWIDTSGLDRLLNFNLWGALPATFTNLSSGTFFSSDVSPLVTGHTGMGEWYLTRL